MSLPEGPGVRLRGWFLASPAKGRAASSLPWRPRPCPRYLDRGTRRGARATRAALKRRDLPVPERPGTGAAPPAAATSRPPPVEPAGVIAGQPRRLSRRRPQHRPLRVTDRRHRLDLLSNTARHPVHTTPTTATSPRVRVPCSRVLVRDGRPSRAPASGPTSPPGHQQGSLVCAAGAAGRGGAAAVAYGRWLPRTGALRAATRLCHAQGAAGAGAGR